MLITHYQHISLQANDTKLQRIYKTNLENDFNLDDAIADTNERQGERARERESPKRAIAEENGEFEFLYIRSIWCAWILIINTTRMKWNDSALFQRHTKQKFVSRMQYHLDIGSQIVRSMCIIVYCLGLFALGFYNL